MNIFEVRFDAEENVLLLRKGQHQLIMDILEEESEIILFCVANCLSHFLFKDLEELCQLVIAGKLILN
jgi:hypothetical protein